MTACQLSLRILGANARWRSHAPHLRTIIGLAVRAAWTVGCGETECVCTIQLADDDAVRALNAQFRGKDKPTNVLSFPSDEPGYLGDIILARETIEREAAEQGKSVVAHLQHMVVHGVLHLMGYDHEENDAAETMEAIEIEILKSLGVDNPYAVP